MKESLYNDELMDDELELAEPHFDDEATVLSARPVVPLAKVKNKDFKLKRGAFGLALFCSLAVGFLGATLVYRQRNQKNPVEVTNAAVPGADGKTTEPPSTTPPVVVDSGVASVTGMTEPANSEPQVTDTQRVSAKPKANAPAAPKPVVVKKAENFERPKVAQHAERPRRVNGDEAREHQRRSDGAWRIREIFEGSPRP